MKSMMKKIAAILTMVLMLAQVMPALGETYSSGMIVGSPEGYKEALEIVATKGTYVLLGQTLVLDANEDYEPEWKSGNPAVATIDEDGVVTAVAEGTSTITATVHSPQTQTATIDVTVIDPEPIITEGEPETGAEGETEPEGGLEGVPTGEPEGEPEEEPEEQPPVPSEKKSLLIVINGENERVTYDGEEHLLDRFVATANEDYFDETRVKVEGELGVTGKDCGFYELDLAAVSFTYDDPDVTAHFVLNNSFLKITPATATVTVEPATKEEGEEDPELKAAVTGLMNAEDTIEYKLERDPGEEPGMYMINAVGEESQGNYRVEYIGNVMTITEKPEEPEPLTVDIFLQNPTGDEIESGMELTLTAVVSGAEEGEYTVQWQYSEDLENWIDIPGANSLNYTFTADGKTVTYAWRVVAERIQ